MSRSQIPVISFTKQPAYEQVYKQQFLKVVWGIAVETATAKIVGQTNICGL
jgi:hypothetical protein